MYTYRGTCLQQPTWLANFHFITVLTSPQDIKQTKINNSFLFTVFDSLDRSSDTKISPISGKHWSTPNSRCLLFALRVGSLDKQRQHWSECSLVSSCYSQLPLSTLYTWEIQPGNLIWVPPAVLHAPKGAV